MSNDVKGGMYINRPLDDYVHGTEVYDYRDKQTPSYYHRFLLPPQDNKYVQKYHTPLLQQRYENCAEVHEKCIKCPGFKYEVSSGREWHDIENPTQLIETSDEFIIQFKNSILVVKVMMSLYVFIIMLKILLYFSKNA